MTDDGSLEIVASPSLLLRGPVARLVLAALWIGLAVSLDPIPVVQLVLGGCWVIMGALSLVGALRAMGVVLRIGPDGIVRTGRSRQTWDEIVMVWVGYVPRRWPARGLQSLHLRIYTRSGVAFARRADADVRASATYVVPTTVSSAELCTALRRVTTAVVLDGIETPRWRAERQLERT